MSLGKLLATGRSLVGGAPGLGRYNISERNRLPTFGSGKNPFAPSATSEAKAAAPVEVKTEPAPVTISENSVVEERIAELVRVTESVCQPEQPVEELIAAPQSPFSRTQRIPELESEGILGKVGAVVAWLVRICTVSGGYAAVSARKTWRFVSGIKWKSLLKSGRGLATTAWTKTKAISTKAVGLILRREPKQVFPRLGKPAVQTELSLDTVRVVRNSLEDSDLEIVTAQTSTSSQVAPTKPVAESKRGPVPTVLKKITGPLVSVKEFEKALD